MTQNTPSRIAIHTDKPGKPLSPLFYGLMTEEINFGYEGGLYAELIRNRSLMESADTPLFWSVVDTEGSSGTIAVDTDHPEGTAITRSLRIDSADAGVSVANSGFWGIPVKPNTTYRVSFFARAAAEPASVTVSLQSATDGAVAASATITGITSTWQKYETTLTTGELLQSLDNRFIVIQNRPGTLWLTQVSLFPPTYNNRPNGCRVDIMEKLAAMNQSFLRFPGGNYLEGNILEERFDWKRTLGPIEQRPGHMCPWGYWSTDGMGLMEFLLWCEDIKVEPLLGVYAGYSLHGAFIPAGPDLEPYVQDALDEIEYVIGDVGTPWGARRAADGHPEPFPLRYVEIGNEDYFDKSGSYSGRFGQFAEAIKAKYPQLQIISSGDETALVPDVVDHHYYRTPLAMQMDHSQYTHTDRSGPKIFVGEWATMQGNPTPDWEASFSDAVWLTHLESNADHVIMECYAPLLVNVNTGAQQWGTNLIGFDALTCFASPSYYVQQTFAGNAGDTILPITVDVEPIPAKPLPPPSGQIGLGSWATQVEYKDVRVTQGDTVLFSDTFTDNAGQWEHGEGIWAVVDGALTQTDMKIDCQTAAGDTAWTDYTLDVKARKRGGYEAFLLVFRRQDSKNWLRWNIGASANSRTYLQRSVQGDMLDLWTPHKVTIETDRWYDLRVSVEGRRIRCYIDGVLIIEMEEPPLEPLRRIHATASFDTPTGDTILKAVNVTGDPITTSIDLGAKQAASATAVVLSGDPASVNSVEQPELIAPQTTQLDVSGTSFTHTFPAYSVTVLRLKG